MKPGLIMENNTGKPGVIRGCKLKGYEVSFLPMRLVEEEKNKIHLTEFKKYSEKKQNIV